MRNTGAVLGVVICFSGAACAAEAPLATMKVTDVTVFKDGHALVMARGQAELADGWCRTREVPAPVLGTFWAFTAAPDAKVDFVKAGFVEAKETIPCLSLDQMIQANKGKEATIVEQFKDAPPASHTGILRGIIEHEAERETPVTRTTPLTYDRWGRYINPSNIPETREETVRSLGSFVMLETKEGMKLIQRDSIRSVTVGGKDAATTFTDTKKVREIALHVAAKGKAASGKQEVGVVYLQKGVRWIPSYRIELLDGGKAKVSLNGTIINELADMENVNVRLVVGVPSFVMRETLSPLALREAGLRLSSYFQPPTPSGRGGEFDFLSNALMSQRAAQVMEAPAAGPGAGGPDIPAEGQQEDLFLYALKGVSLKKGESAAVDILDVTVPYEDLYVWEVPCLPPMEMWRNIDRNQQQQLMRALGGARAMHQLRLTNTGETPWTTGPATIFKGATPLGQQLLTYTSVKNKVDVSVTIATDLNTKKEESETGRQPNAITIDGNAYTKVSVHGKLTVTNFKGRDVHVVVRRSFMGTGVKASHDGKVTASNPLEASLTDVGAEPYPWWYWWNWPWYWLRANGFGQVSWDLTIAKGKAVELEYDFYYYWRP
ncbi:MAG: DUF4139 domain-containing protein [Planctomycetes bacterium]|nr:DUF4139 domain-containing protein [Planctomycetota bacterium]